MLQLYSGFRLCSGVELLYRKIRPGNPMIQPMNMTSIMVKFFQYLSAGKSLSFFRSAWYASLLEKSTMFHGEQHYVISIVTKCLFHSRPVVPKLFWCADHLKYFSAPRSKTRPVLDRFHDSSKVNALVLCSVLCALCSIFSLVQCAESLEKSVKEWTSMSKP